MHLEAELRAGRNELRHAIEVDSRGTAWRKPRHAPGPTRSAPRLRRHRVDDDVVNHRAIVGASLGRRDPLVFRPARVRGEVLVFDDAFGRHVIRLLGHVVDLVRFRDLPAYGELWRFRQIGWITFGRAIGDPRLDILYFFLGQSAVVLELAVLGVGEPRRHLSLVDDLDHHLAPAVDLVVVRQRERRDLAFSMARHAARVQDARDLVRVGHVAVRFDLGNTADDAAGGNRPWGSDLLPGQQLCDRVRQITRLELRLGITGSGTESVLVVDAAEVTDDMVLVQQEGLGSTLCLKQVRDRVVGIFQDRIAELVDSSERSDLRHRVLGVGVDREEPDSLALELSMEPFQPWSVEFRQRTVGTDEDHGYRMAAILVQGSLLASIVAQREISDLFPQAGFGSVGGFRRHPGHQNSQQTSDPGGLRHRRFSCIDGLRPRAVTRRHQGPSITVRSDRDQPNRVAGYNL